MELMRIKPSHIDKFYALLAAPEHPLSSKSLSQSRVQRHHALLHRAFSFAMRDRLIKVNPCDLVERPRSSRQSPEIPSQTAVQARLDALANKASYLPCAIALITGMRQSEVLGLKWDAVNLETDKLKVCCVRQQPGRKRLADVQLNAYTRIVPFMPGCIERDCTKSKKNRTISIPPELTALLKAARSQQKANRLRFGPRYILTDYVCTYEDGLPMSANTLAKAMNGVCRYHDLRHINALQLLKAGHSVATVADRLGHTTPVTTLNFYAHSLEDQDKAAAQTMSSVYHLKT